MYAPSLRLELLAIPPFYISNGRLYSPTKAKQSFARNTAKSGSALAYQNVRRKLWKR
jgi:hypothetical protein